MSKLYKGNNILGKFRFGAGIHRNHVGISGDMFYKFNIKRFVYNKKDEVEEFENRIKKYNEMYKDFDKNIDKLFEQEMKNPKKKPHKPIRITYIDMKNKKKTKEYLMDVKNTDSNTNPDNKSEINVDNKKNDRISDPKDDLSNLAGLNEKFPEENFVEIYSKQNSKKIKLQTYRYPAKDKLKGIVYLLHGLFEHSNSNANIARILSENGYEVIAMDMRGHGKSEGKRGYFENMKVMIDDFKNFINTTENLYKYKIDNKYVLGYSFGGLYANLLSIEMQNYFNGMIMIAPPLSIDVRQYDFWLKVGNIIRNIFPSLPLIKLKHKSENKALLNYFKSDPLIYKGRMRLGTAYTILESMNYSNENVDKVTTPFFLLHGARDKDCDAKGSTKFYEKAKILDKTYILNDNYDHFITRHHDIDKLTTDIAFWMDMHLR